MVCVEGSRQREWSREPSVPILVSYFIFLLFGLFVFFFLFFCYGYIICGVNGWSSRLWGNGSTSNHPHTLSVLFVVMVCSLFLETFSAESTHQNKICKKTGIAKWLDILILIHLAKF